MAKLNVFALPRPERPALTKRFDLDGEPFFLTVRAADNSDRAAAREREASFVSLYLTGSEDRDAAPFPITGIKVSRLLFTEATLLREMQCPEDEADRYDEIELIGLSIKRPRDWETMQVWVGQLQMEWQSGRPFSPSPNTD